VTLRPTSAAEYASWLAAAVPEYAAAKVAAGQWPEGTALDRARREFADLLPRGRLTPDHHLYTVLGDGGVPVGTLWFAVQERAGQRIAWVYDVVIAPEHRRQGHAFRAFQALEAEVARLGLGGIALHVFGHNRAAQALYVKLGYSTTNINMYKPVARRA
jgi:ribosomal protein S18 acetylase RimI-like enzyme